MTSEVEQVHLAYLDSLYVLAYFRAVRAGTGWWSRHLDLLIALGTSAGGATGFVGLVSKIPQLAWVCGPLTLVGGGLSVARSVYGWGKEIEAATKVVTNYGQLSTEYRFLIDDINTQCKWDAALKKRAADLRQRRLRVMPDDYPDLPDTTTKAIQAAVRSSINRSAWWTPQPVSPKEPTVDVASPTAQRPA
jgi:hypothetical protein